MDEYSALFMGLGWAYLLMRDFYIAPRHTLRLLGFSLLAQHSVTLLSNPWLAKTAFFIHLVFLFLWKNTENNQNISYKFPLNKWLPLSLLALILLSFHQYLIGIWQLLLISLLASRSLYFNKERFFNFAGLLFLSIDLFVVDVPYLFLNISPLLAQYFYLPPLAFIAVFGIIPLLFLLINTKNLNVNVNVEKFDFLYGLSVSFIYLLLIFVSLFLLQIQISINYPQALLASLLGLILFFVSASQLWLTFSEKLNFQQLWMRHWQNTDNVFKQWLSGLTQADSYRSLDSELLIESSLKQLLNIPWIHGIEWKTTNATGSLGDKSHYFIVITVQSLTVTFYTWQQLNVAYHTHMKLLVQLLEHFHQSKQREKDYAQQAHLKAIYETGAKLTHDIKNLLQSLFVITSAIQTVKPDQLDDSELGNTHRLLQGQLPHLSQRLKLTLDKLKQPVDSSYHQINIRTWWDNLCARYHKRDIVFSANIISNTKIPEDLFDNVVENLLENALNKRQREISLNIRVSLVCVQKEIQLSVCDNGTPVPSNIERQLLSQPVASRDGFGIGLYHAAKLTFHSSYQLQLSHNKIGKVCFELKYIEKKS